MSHATRFAIGAALALTLPAAAQGLTLRVSTWSGITVRANQSQNSIPANTDLTGGRTLRVDDFPPTGTYASATIATVHGQNQSTVALSATAFGARGSPVTNASADGHGITVTWSAATPTFGRLRVEWCRYTSGALAFFGGSSQVVGCGTLQATTTCPAPSSMEHLVVVDAAGLVVQYTASAWANGAGMVSASAGGQCSLTLTIDPNQPCAGQPYGASCGPGLTAATVAAFPGRLALRVDDSVPLAAAVLLVGTLRTSLPLPGGCTLHNEMLLALPLVPQGTAASTLLDPGPWPGLRLTAQGYTLPLAPAGLRLTEGLELTCR